ncbi:MAG: DUF4855 domain-containing protein [bacterium]|nr:DUF4855 domain-containing protein [bacterium]
MFDYREFDKLFGMSVKSISIFFLIQLLTHSAFSAYMPEGDSRAGGIHHLVLFYSLNAPSPGTRSRMPWISADGNTLFFVNGNYGAEEIWYSEKTSGIWKPARKVVELDIPDISEQSPCLTSDGQRIYFTSNRAVGPPYNLDSGRWRIFTATRNASGGWNSPYLVNDDAAPGINVTTLTDGHDFGVFLSRDNQTLYFCSSRSGGYGGYDIWYSKKDVNGKWTAPVNIGSPINSTASEQSGVSVTADELTMYVASNRTDIRIHGSDTWNIYRAVRSSTTQPWSTASVSQVGTISPATTSTSWGVSWPCISSDGNILYYSDKGPYLWQDSIYDIFYSINSGGMWQAPKNIGRAINNLSWSNRNDYLPYVAYLEATTKWVLDTMFDAALYLALSGSPSGQNYATGSTNKVDWLSFIDTIHHPDMQLSMLNQVVGEVKTTLNLSTSYKMKIVMMIPYPNPGVSNFGDVDGDGLTENLSTDSVRLKVVKWYLNELFSRWSTANYSNLDWVALYWMVESGSDASLVRQIADEVHKRGMKFLWIPYYSATGWSTWTSYRFDGVIYQPNYAWMFRTGSPDPNRLSTAAQRARTYTMGIEIELDNRPLTDGINLRTYLDYGNFDREAYIGDCLLGYYQNVDSIKRFCFSSYDSAPYARDAYDNIYHFIKERYPTLLSIGKPYAYSPSPDANYPDISFTKLNDFRYLPDTTTTLRVVGFQNVNPVITFNLQSTQLVQKVYGHFLGGNYSGISFPASMKVEVSTDSTNWQHVGTTSVRPTESGNAISGDMLVTFSPCYAKYVRITLTRNNTWVMIDEIQIYSPVRPVAVELSSFSIE